MSQVDWRSPGAYRAMQYADVADFAWECLRRNDDYRTDYQSLPEPKSPFGVNDGFRQRWGLTFRR
jgi:hypothetical protein